MQIQLFYKKLECLIENYDSLSIQYKYYEFNDGHRDSNWNQGLADILIQFFGK